MLSQLIQQYGSQIENFHYLLSIINLCLHLIFAGAVAKDAGHLYQLGRKPALVSGSSWAFAVLLGGLYTAAIYWFIHHSTFTKSSFTRDSK